MNKRAKKAVKISLTHPIEALFWRDREKTGGFGLFLNIALRLLCYPVHTINL